MSEESIDGREETIPCLTFSNAEGNDVGVLHVSKHSPKCGRRLQAKRGGQQNHRRPSYNCETETQMAQEKERRNLTLTLQKLKIYQVC